VNCNVSLQIVPLVAEEKIYPLVDQVITLIKDSGVKYLVGPMETTMEGELDQLLKLVGEAHQLCISQGAGRIISVVKIDQKIGGVTIEEKIKKHR